MTFEAPAFLLALALLPLAGWAYVRAQQRRRLAAESFATRATMPSVTPAAPGWRRHAPVAIYAAAVVALALALARPQAVVAVPKEQAAVVLATDESGSMQATDVEPSRLDAARRAAGDFLDAVPDDLRVGAVAFSDAVRRAEPPATDRERVSALLDSLRPSGGTATGDALAASLRLLRRNRDDRRTPAAIVLLSDGASTSGRDPLAVAREAAEAGVPVHTVALGTDSGTIEVPTRSGVPRLRSVPPDRETLERIAQVTGGRAYAAAGGDELDAVYEELGSRVATEDEEREITAAFAGGAVLLLLAGGALSLRWFGRLP